MKKGDKMRIALVFCIAILFFASNVFSAGMRNESIENNICTQTFPIDKKIVERIEIYPADRSVGEVVYVVSYWENVSEETVPNVCNFWVGFFRPYSRSLHWYGSNNSSQPLPSPSPLKPGEKRIQWFFMLHDDFCKDIGLETVFPQKGFFLPLRFEEEYSFSYDGSQVLKRRSRENEWDMYSDAILQDLPLIQKWYRFTPATVIDRSPEGGMDIYQDVIPSSENPLPTGDDVYDLYVGDTAMGADDRLLSSPSTVRDEIQLTRMIFEYLHSSGKNERTSLLAVTQFVESKPFPQKIVMTHRLFRMETDLPFTGISSWPRWYACAPPPLPEGWEAKLLKLNEKFREIRENALNE